MVVYGLELHCMQHARVGELQELLVSEAHPKIHIISL